MPVQEGLMATFLAHITVKPGREADFERVAAEHYGATHALEPQMGRYEFWRGADDRVYYCHATFDDFVAFVEHQTSDHHETFGPMLRDTFEIFRLEWVDPIATSSPLAATIMRRGPSSWLANTSMLKPAGSDSFAPAGCATIVGGLRADSVANGAGRFAMSMR